MILVRRLGNRFERVKWWFMRANGKLPPCDWWDYKYNLADYIKQGLENLLYNGNTDWDCDYHKQEKEDLEFILKWATEFPWYESAIIAMDDEDLERLKKKFPPDEYMVITLEEANEFDKRTKKAMKLLGERFRTLWD